jgi:hypothetical protein
VNTDQFLNYLYDHDATRELAVELALVRHEVQRRDDLAALCVPA